MQMVAHANRISCDEFPIVPGRAGILDGCGKSEGARGIKYVFIRSKEFRRLFAVFCHYMVSPSLQCGGRPGRISVADDGVVRGRSDGDGLLSEPVEEQASCF